HARRESAADPLSVEPGRACTSASRCRSRRLWSPKVSAPTPGSSFNFNQDRGTLDLASNLRITPFSNSSLNRSAETPVNVGCRPFRAPPDPSAPAEDVFYFVEEAFVPGIVSLHVSHCLPLNSRNAHVLSKGVRKCHESAAGCYTGCYIRR